MSEQFVSRKRRNRNNAIILSLLTFAVLGLGGWFSWQYRDVGSVPQNALAQVVGHEGSFRVKRDNKQFPGEQDFLILAGDKIQTRPAATLDIEYLDETVQLNLHGGTIVLFENPQPGKKFRLQSGQVDMEVQQIPDQGAIAVESNNAVATVLQAGSFSFQFHGLQTVLKVQSGKLHIRRIRDGFQTTLSLGESFCCQPEADQARIEFQEDLDL